MDPFPNPHRIPPGWSCSTMPAPHTTSWGPGGVSRPGWVPVLDDPGLDRLDSVAQAQPESSPSSAPRPSRPTPAHHRPLRPASPHESATAQPGHVKPPVPLIPVQPRWVPRSSGSASPQRRPLMLQAEISLLRRWAQTRCPIRGAPSRRPAASGQPDHPEAPGVAADEPQSWPGDTAGMIPVAARCPCSRLRPRPGGAARLPVTARRGQQPTLGARRPARSWVSRPASRCSAAATARQAWAFRPTACAPGFGRELLLDAALALAGLSVLA